MKVAPEWEVSQATAREWTKGLKPLDPASYELYLDQSPLDAMVSPEGLSPEQVERLRAQWLRRLRSIGYVQEEEN